MALGILAILAGALGMLVGGINVFGILVKGYPGGRPELVYQALGFVLSAANLLAWISILSGRSWGRTLVYWLCGASIVHSSVFNGVLNTQTLGWAASSALSVWILHSPRSQTFFTQHHLRAHS